MEEERSWYAYEAGSTQNKRGPVGGKVLRDEEYGDAEDTEDADARITLEQQRDDSYAVTANLYGGWLQETASFGSLTDAEAAYISARQTLAELAALLPDEEDRNIDKTIQNLNERIAAFSDQFGGEPTL